MAAPTLSSFSALPEYPRKRRSFFKVALVICAFIALVGLYTTRRPIRQYYDEYKAAPPAHNVDDRPSPDMANGHFDRPLDGEAIDLEDHYRDGAATTAATTTTTPAVETSTLQAWEEVSGETAQPWPPGLLASSSSISAEPSSPTPSGPPIPEETPLDHSLPRSRLPEDLQNLLEWDPPTWATLHAPAYDAFDDTDYDPNRWEAFDQNQGFWLNGTLSDMNRFENQSLVYAPYPSYNSQTWKRQWRGEHVPCIGLDGYAFNESETGLIKAYLKPAHFPDPDAGSYEAIGLDSHVCFERDTRLSHVGWDNLVDIGSLNLGALQDACLERNKDRYELNNAPALRPGKDIKDFRKGLLEETDYKAKPRGPQFKARTAVLLRAWEDYTYQDNDIHTIRSLVSELSLQSGGEYQIFLFVNVKDEEAHIFEDPEVYEAKLNTCVPEEFRDMTILWNERLSADTYPDVGEYRVGIAQYMPVQWFMATHPEFEYLWNWEMDARYIGNTYHFVEKIQEFAKRQPRKNLWERNARFYIPKAHGTWEDFFNATNEIIEKSGFVGSIWGPDTNIADFALGPDPPCSVEEDEYKWGVGEEADFISLLPMWDPLWTTWGWRHTIYNWEDPFVTRRAYINTHARFSRRLLRAMHEENVRGRSMMAEMWPSTVAMHHGLKAVHAPQPIWFSHEWPGDYADLVFNSDGWGAGSFFNESNPDELGVNQQTMHVDNGRGVAYNETLARLQLPQTGSGPNGEGAFARWGQERDSIYNGDREHNFKGWSWYYWSDFGRMIYWRWLGWRSTYSAATIGWKEATDPLPDAGTSDWESSHGRLCLPGMLLHPVKNVKRPETPSKSGETKQVDNKADNQAAGGGVVGEEDLADDEGRPVAKAPPPQNGKRPPKA